MKQRIEMRPRDRHFRAGYLCGVGCGLVGGVAFAGGVLLQTDCDNIFYNILNIVAGGLALMLLCLGRKHAQE